MDETVRTVGSGTSAMVSLWTTVSYVEIGRVMGLVMESGEVDGGAV